MSEGHSRLSPSGAHRWANCPGAPEAESYFPESSSPAARQGTAAHLLNETCGLNGFEPEYFLGQKIPVAGRNGEADEEIEVDADMIDGANLYLETVRQYHNPAAGDVLAWESRLPIPFLPGDQWGTADTVVQKPTERGLIVVDYKYGFGIVEVEDNLQGLCYAAAAALQSDYPLDWVEIVIVQPRPFHKDGKVRRWRISSAELMDRVAYLKKSAEATLEPNAPRNPGSWCKFCKAAGNCSALSAQCLAEAQMAFSATDTPPDPEALTPEQVGEVLTRATIIKDWISNMQSHAEDLIRQGVEVPGWKLVDKYPRRQFTDEDAVVKEVENLGFQKELLFTTKMKTPNQVESLIGKKNHHTIKPYIVSVSGGLTLVDSEDKRPASDGRSTAGADFSAAFTPVGVSDKGEN